MTTPHVIAYYLDGRMQVAYCKKCSAEGEKLLEGCPQKISSNCVDTDKIEEDFLNYSLDEKKPTAK